MPKVQTARIFAGVRRIGCSIRTCLCRVGGQIRDAWRAHRDRVAEDPAYGAALAGVVVAACELITQDPRVVAVVAAITTGYISISRVVHPPWDADDWRWQPDQYDN